MADASDTPAVDIGEAIQRGVALLAQQSVATPTFTMTAVTDLYREGVRATKSRAPAARVLEAWADAAAALPAPLPMTIERALEGLSEPTVAEAVLAAYSAATATRLAKAQAQKLSPSLAPAASTAMPRDGAGARLAMAQLVRRAQDDIVVSGVLAHRDSANKWIKLHAEACAAAIRDDALRTAFISNLNLDNCKMPQNAAWNGKHAFTLWEAENERRAIAHPAPAHWRLHCRRQQTECCPRGQHKPHGHLHTERHDRCQSHSSGNN